MTMAYKRRVVVSKAAKAPPDEERDELDEEGWKIWLLRRYARMWFWVLMLFIDIIIFLELQRSLRFNPLVAGAVTIAMGVVQLAIFAKIWGKGGRLGGEYDEE